MGTRATGTAALLLALACSREPGRGEAPASAPSASPAPTTPAPTRVVLITLDTVRADHLGCYGCDRPLTPNVDELARAGLRFVNAHAPMPATGPSHSSMLSGRAPLSHGLVNHGLELSNDVVLLPEVLARRGVATGAFYHLFPFDEMNVTQGFTRQSRDVSLDAASVVPQFFQWWDELPAEKPRFGWIHLFLAHTPLKPPADLRQRFMPHAAGAEIDDRPETLMRYHTQPGSAPAGYEQQFGELYDAKVAFDDRRVGELVAGLKQRGALAGTLLILEADHGEGLEPGMLGMHVFDWRDSSLHVPLIFRGPGVPAGKAVDDAVSLWDLAPTLFELFAAPAPDGMEGTSLLPLFRGAEFERAHDVWATLPVEQENYAAGRGPRALFCWSGRWKYVLAEPDDRAADLLFDLSNDPLEKTNVAADHDDVVRGLRRRLLADVARAREKKSVATSLDEKSRALLKGLGYGER